MPPDSNSHQDPGTLVHGGGFVLTNPEPEPHQPASVGELLATGREHAGLSVGDVASRLRMSVKQIEALERADYVSLPSGTFLRGFVRNYAKAVGVNIDEALKVLEHTHTDALALKATSVVAPTIAAEPGAYQPRSDALATPKSRAIIAVLLVACLSAVVWYWWEFVRPHRADGGRPKDAQAVVQPVIAPPPSNLVSTDAPSSMPTDPNIATGVSIPYTSSPISTPPVAPSAPGAVVASSASPSPVPSLATAALSEKASGKAAEKVVANKGVVNKAVVDNPAADNTKPKRLGESGVLGFTFSGESWVEVTDGAGRTVISRRYKAGEADEVTGKGPFSVVVGNAAATRMAVNGREFDLAPHTRATVARVTVK